MWLCMQYVAVHTCASVSECMPTHWKLRRCAVSAYDGILAFNMYVLL